MTWIIDPKSEQDQELPFDPKSLQRQCDQCNDKRLNAKAAGEKCQLVMKCLSERLTESCFQALLCVRLRQEECVYATLGAVLALQDQSIWIFIPSLKSCSRVFYNNVLDPPNKSLPSTLNKVARKIKVYCHAGSAVMFFVFALGFAYIA